MSKRFFFASIQMKLILLAPWPWTCSLSKIYIFLHLSAFYHLGQQIASGTILGLTTCCYPLYMFFVLLLLFDAFAFKVMYLSSFGDPKVLYPQKGFFSSPLSPGRSLYWDIYPIGLHFFVFVYRNVFWFSLRGHLWWNVLFVFPSAVKVKEVAYKANIPC